ncbi:DNA repair protein RadC [Anaerococcus murdochii]|uniref:DNA repair protein RadC n=1 Tax=Anaerococcus murdochii TaxID=411577 RepID=A0ABS7SW57_9FIRM|nr:DNA repair protein RadC [Anaerococcus murdochii]MBZ2385760.1 DNA repair protein RadC [Anaerococcus murdochii]
MKQTIKDMKLIDRPREKLIKLGHDSLSEKELLAIIISTGTDKKNAIDLAEEILETFSEEALLEIEVEELTKINGIKEAKASKIIASLQLGKRIKENILNKEKYKISSNEDAYEYIKDTISLRDREYFYTILLNNKNEVISKELISIGDLSSSIVNPREVFKPAIKKSAKSMILAHNHPSGNPSPSKADLLITHRLIDAGEILDINVLDHLIIGHGSYVSLKKDNYI